MARPVGTILAEIGLDDTPFTRGLARVREAATTGTLKIEDAYRQLGSKSASTFDAMRANATLAFETITKSGIKSADELARVQKLHADQLDKINAQQYGAAAISKQESFFQSLKSNWIAASAAIYASMRVIGQAWDMATSAADYQERVESLDALGKQAGLTGREIVTAMQSAALGMISMSEAADLAAKALNLSLSPTQMIDFTKVATQLTDVVGGTIPEAFEKMTTAAATGRTQSLAQLGIIVDLESAYKRYAAAHSRAADSLTAREKQEIRLNEILAVAKEKVDVLGESTLSSADKMQRATAAIKDMTLWVGEKLAGAFVLLMDSVNPVNSVFEKQQLLLGENVIWLDIYKKKIDEVAAAHKSTMLPDVREQLRPSARVGEAQRIESEEDRKAREAKLAKAKKDAEELRKITTQNQYESLKAQQAILVEADALGDRFRMQQAKDTEELQAESLRQQEAILKEAETLGDKYRSEEYKRATDSWEKTEKEKETITKEFIQNWVALIDHQQQEDFDAAKAMADAQADAARKSESEWQRSVFNVRGYFEDMTGGIKNALSTSIKGIIMGTQTLEDAFKRMGENIALGLVDSIINRGINAVSNTLLDFAFGKGGGGMTGGALSGLIGGIGTLFSGAGTSLLGWGKTAVEGIGSFLGLLQTGMWSVPDLRGQEWAVLHPGEMVLPPGIAGAVRAAGGLRDADGRFIWSSALAGKYTGGVGGLEYSGGAAGVGTRGPQSTSEAVVEGFIGSMTPGWGIATGFAQAANAMLGAYRAFASPMAAIASVLGMARNASNISVQGLVNSGWDKTVAQSVVDAFSSFSPSTISAIEQAFGGLKSAISRSLDEASSNLGSPSPSFGNFGGYGYGDVGYGGMSGMGGGVGTTSGPGSTESGFGTSDTAGPSSFASGGLFNTSRRTRMIVGEAGNETVAVLRNPRNVETDRGVTINLYNSGVLGNQLPDALMREIRRELDRRESRLLRY